MDKFLLLLGPHITFMSIMIFNSEILHKVLENNINYETNLYQSFLAINVIHKNEKCAIQYTFIIRFHLMEIRLRPTMISILFL